MSTTNRVRLSSTKELTIGTTPPSPRMRLERITDERLTSAPQFIDSNELRFDRMSSDPIEVKLPSGGGSYGFEMSYPDPNSPLSDDLEFAFYNHWTSSTFLSNDGVVDSVITDVGTTANTVAVTAGGAAFLPGMLVRLSGLSVPANNQTFAVTTSTATTIVGAGLTLVAETTPPGTASIKAVGFQGASGDIAATASGLSSTALDFTTMGLTLGQFIKVGGTGGGFPIAAMNTFARVVSISTTALGLDNLPPEWVVAAGTGIALKIFAGDGIVNGATQVTMTKEVGFMDQSPVPSYLQFVGMTVNTLDVNLTANQVIQGTIAWTGRAATSTLTTLDATPDPATIGRVMAAHASVGRLAEAGARLGDPNWARSLTFQINNNQRTIDDVASPSVAAINEGECTVTGRLETYFGDNSRLVKLFDAVPTNLSCRFQKDNQALIWSFPRVTFRGGDPQVTGKNQDITLPLDFRASLDPLTGVQIRLDRIPYYET